MTPMHLEPEPMDRLLAGEGGLRRQTLQLGAVACGQRFAGGFSS